MVPGGRLELPRPFERQNLNVFRGAAWSGVEWLMNGLSPAIAGRIGGMRRHICYGFASDTICVQRSET